MPERLVSPPSRARGSGRRLRLCGRRRLDDDGRGRLLLLLLARRRGDGRVRRRVAERDGLRDCDRVRARGGRVLDAAAQVVGPVDARRDEEEYLVGVAKHGLSLEEVAEHWETPKAGRAVLRLALAVVQDAADDGRSAV